MSNGTGIIRRIDDLGRVVIPREVRKVFKIREGDPLEIFVTKEGVLLKKYSPFEEFGEFAKEYAESLWENTGHTILISDRDTFIAVAGTQKYQYLEKSVGGYLESSMENRREIIKHEEGKYEIVSGAIEEIQSIIVVPIVVGGDPIGSVAVLSKDKGVLFSKTEVKLAETAASFLAKQME